MPIKPRSRMRVYIQPAFFKCIIQMIHTRCWIENQAMIDQPTVAEKRALYQASMERALIAITEQLKAIPQVEKVILFGSYATGRRDLFTDLDLIVIIRYGPGFCQPDCLALSET